MHSPSPPPRSASPRVNKTNFRNYKFTNSPFNNNEFGQFCIPRPQNTNTKSQYTLVRQPSNISDNDNFNSKSSQNAMNVSDDSFPLLSKGEERVMLESTIPRIELPISPPSKNSISTKYRRSISTVTTHIGYIPRIVSTVGYTSSQTTYTSAKKTLNCSMTNSTKPTSCLNGLINKTSDLSRSQRSSIGSCSPTSTTGNRFFPVDNRSSLIQRRKSSDMSESDNLLDSNGITIDTLLQQLRALS